jgi:hypothetical protein
MAEKKKSAVKKLNKEELEQYSGGLTFFNPELHRWEVINDRTGEVMETANTFGTIRNKAAQLSRPLMESNEVRPDVLQNKK